MATRGRITLSYYEFHENLIPPYCMMTGERTDDEKTFRFFKTPSWIYLLMFMPFCVPVWLFAVQMTLQSRRITLPIMTEHHDFFLYRRMLFLIVLLCHISTISILQFFSSSWLRHLPLWIVVIIYAVSVALVVVDVVIVLRYKLHIVHVSDTTITFGGVHPTFIEMIRTTRGIRSRELER